MDPLQNTGNDNIVSRTIKKHGMIEVLMFFFIIVVGFTVSYKRWKKMRKTLTNSSKEGFSSGETSCSSDHTNKSEISIIRGNDIYNFTYAAIYDKLTYHPERFNIEINEIMKTVSSPHHTKLLDIGSGTGKHVHTLSSKMNEAIGIDISPAMISKSQELYPTCDYQNKDASNINSVIPNSFTHISCMYFTIYYIHDHPSFLHNCYSWLKPGGYLVVHLADPRRFDPDLESSNLADIWSVTRYNRSRITQTPSTIYSLEYSSKFNYFPKENKASLRETIKNTKTDYVRYQEHILYMPSIKEITDAALSEGFILSNTTSLKNCDHDHQYIYTFQKPS